MKYARIDLEKTNYELTLDFELDPYPDVYELQEIYMKYCHYKKFDSVMPIFDSEFDDLANDVITYKDKGKTVAFSLIRRYDWQNVEAIQFAWDYENPQLRLGIESLKNECAFYKHQQFRYLYIGGADEYKNEIDGFEILPGIDYERSSCIG